MISFTHFFQAFDKFGNLLKTNKRCKYDVTDHTFSIVLSLQNIICVSDCTLTSEVMTYFKRRMFFALYHDCRPIHKKQIIKNFV